MMNHQISVHRDPQKDKKCFQDVIADVSSIISRFPTDPYFFQVSNCSETQMRRCIKATMNSRCSNCVWNVPELVAFTALLRFGGELAGQMHQNPSPIGNMIVYRYLYLYIHVYIYIYNMSNRQNSQILRYVLAGHWFSGSAKNWEVSDGTLNSDTPWQLLR